MGHRLGAALLIAFVTAAAAACHIFEDSATTPSAEFLEKFNGSLKQQGSVVFTFTVSKTSTIDVTLTTMTPSTTATVGMGIGTGSGDACTPTKSSSSVAAGSTAQLSVTENAGSYCVKVYDTGSLNQTQTVTVTVAHS